MGGERREEGERKEGVRPLPQEENKKSELMLMRRATASV